MPILLLWITTRARFALVPAEVEARSPDDCRNELLGVLNLENAEYVAAYNAKRRREYRDAHPLTTRPCSECGEPMTKPANVVVCGE